MGALLSALAWIAGKALDGVKQVAVSLKSAAIQCKGFLLALFVVNAKSVILQGLVFSAVFLLLNTTLQGIMRLFVGLSSWVGLVEDVRDLCPPMLEGVFSGVWESLALDHAFGSCVMVFSAWLSGWTVYKGVEYAVVIRKFGILRGFWPGTLSRLL